MTRHHDRRAAVTDRAALVDCRRGAGRACFVVMRRWVGGYAFAVALLSTISASAQLVTLPPVPVTSTTLRPAGGAFVNLVPFGSGFATTVGSVTETVFAMLDARATVTSQAPLSEEFSNHTSGGRIARTLTGFLMFGKQSLGDALQVRAADESGNFVGAPIPIGVTTTSVGTHRIACAASNCLLVWIGRASIQAIRVTHAGALIDPAPFTVSTSTSTEWVGNPELATDGVDYLVAYVKGTSFNPPPPAVWVQRIEAATGALLGGAPTLASGADSTPSTSQAMSVAFHNNRYVIAWKQQSLGATQHPPAVRIFDRNATPIAATATRIDVSPDLPADASYSEVTALSITALSDDRFVLVWQFAVRQSVGYRESVYTRVVTRDQVVLGARSNVIESEIRPTTYPVYVSAAHGASSTVLNWIRYPEGGGLPSVCASTRLGADGEALDTPPLVAFRIPPQQTTQQFRRLSDGSSVLAFEEKFGLDPVDGARSGIRAVRISAEGVVLTPVPLDLGRSSIPIKIVAGDGQFIVVRGSGPYVDFRRYTNDFVPIDATWLRVPGASIPAVASISNDYLLLNFDRAAARNRAGFIVDAMGQYTLLPSPVPDRNFILTATGTHWLLFSFGLPLTATGEGLRIDRSGASSAFLWERPALPAWDDNIMQAESDPWGITLLTNSSMIRLDPSGRLRGNTQRSSPNNFAVMTRAPGVSILGQTRYSPTGNQLDIDIVPDFEPPTTQSNVFPTQSIYPSHLSTGRDRIFVAHQQLHAMNASERVVFSTILTTFPTPPPRPAGSCSCDTRSLGTPARHAVLLLAAATTLTLRRRRRAA